MDNKKIEYFDADCAGYADLRKGIKLVVRKSRGIRPHPTGLPHGAFYRSLSFALSGLYQSVMVFFPGAYATRLCALSALRA